MSVRFVFAIRSDKFFSALTSNLAGSPSYAVQSSSGFAFRETEVDSEFLSLGLTERFIVRPPPPNTAVVIEVPSEPRWEKYPKFLVTGVVFNRPDLAPIEKVRITLEAITNSVLDFNSKNSKVTPRIKISTVGVSDYYLELPEVSASDLSEVVSRL
jgi:hypothetical protein